MNRLLRIVLLLCLVAVAVPSTAFSAARMYVGFYDDAAFRWRPDRIQNLALNYRPGNPFPHSLPGRAQVQNRRRRL